MKIYPYPDVYNPFYHKLVSTNNVRNEASMCTVESKFMHEYKLFCTMPVPEIY